MIEPDRVGETREVSDVVDVPQPVQGRVEHERIGAAPTEEEIVAPPAVENVRTGIAHDVVADVAACQVDLYRPQETRLHAFDTAATRQHEADRSLDRVVSAVDGFDHYVAHCRRRKFVSVAAEHPVDTRAAVEIVVSVPSIEIIVAIAAGSSSFPSSP